MTKKTEKTTLTGFVTNTEAPSLSLNSRRVLWIFVILLVCCTLGAQFEAAGLSLVLSAELLALCTTILWFLARSDTPWRPGRMLLLLLTFATLPYAVYLALSPKMYGLQFLQPDQRATEMIVISAVVTAFFAFWSSLLNDGKHFIIHETQLTLEALVNGSIIDFPPYGSLNVPKGVSQDSLITIVAPGGTWFEADHVVKVDVIPDERFTLKGNNLETKVELIPRDILRGVAVPLATLDGTIRLNVPPLTKAGGRLRLKGLGIPKGRGKKRGHLYARVSIIDDDDWQPTEASPSTWFVSLPALTMSVFEDVLANMGHQLAKRKQATTELLVLLYRGRISTEMTAIERHVTNINRTAKRNKDGRRQGPLLIALVDGRREEVFCPFAEGLKRKILNVARTCQ